MKLNPLSITAVIEPWFQPETMAAPSSVRIVQLGLNEEGRGGGGGGDEVEEQFRMTKDILSSGANKYSAMRVCVSVCVAPAKSNIKR